MRLRSHEIEVRSHYPECFIDDIPVGSLDHDSLVMRIRLLLAELILPAGITFHFRHFCKERHFHGSNIGMSLDLIVQLLEHKEDTERNTKSEEEGYKCYHILVRRLR